MIRVLALALTLLLASCAAPPPIQTRPSSSCDFRMVDLNERLCLSKGKTFTPPLPGDGTCGACQ